MPLYAITTIGEPFMCDGCGLKIQEVEPRGDLRECPMGHPHGTCCHFKYIVVRPDKREVLEFLRSELWDTEGDHEKADDLLLALVGDPEIKVAYDAVERWYA